MIFLGLVRLCEQNIVRKFTAAADHKQPSLKSSSVSINNIKSSARGFELTGWVDWSASAIRLSAYTGLVDWLYWPE